MVFTQSDLVTAVLLLRCCCAGNRAQTAMLQQSGCSRHRFTHRAGTDSKNVRELSRRECLGLS